MGRGFQEVECAQCGGTTYGILNTKNALCSDCLAANQSKSKWAPRRKQRRARRVLEYIDQVGGEATVNDVAYNLNFTRHSAGLAAGYLQSLGILSITTTAGKHGHGGSSLYSLTEKGEALAAEQPESL